jgi:hypothetical protein
VPYSYTAEAIDQDSLHSARATAVQAMVKTIPDQPALKTLQADYDAKAKQVRLRWQYSGSGNYFFILYKGRDALSRFRSLDAGKTEFVDNEIPSGGGKIAYAIQVSFKDKRGQTRVSDPTWVSFSPTK